jgi:putative Mg2+ transporter-C (MgtC) family protein
MAAAVISGIGFLGAGLIIFQQDRVKNLTTAAGLWVAAAIGVSVGFGLYALAITAVILVIITFTAFKNFEDVLKAKIFDFGPKDIGPQDVEK